MTTIKLTSSKLQIVNCFLCMLNNFILSTNIDKNRWEKQGQTESSKCFFFKKYKLFPWTISTLNMNWTIKSEYYLSALKIGAVRPYKNRVKVVYIGYNMSIYFFLCSSICSYGSQFIETVTIWLYQLFFEFRFSSV